MLLSSAIRLSFVHLFDMVLEMMHTFKHPPTQALLNADGARHREVRRLIYPQLYADAKKTHPASNLSAERANARPATHPVLIINMSRKPCFYVEASCTVNQPV